MASSTPDPAIGIDLGTTFSCVGIVQNGKVEIIKNHLNVSTIPSYVAFTDNGRLVGDRAKQWALIDPPNTINNMKRLIGRTMEEENVRKDIDTFNFKVVDDGNGNPNVKVQYEGRDRLFRPEDISAAVLGELKTMAEEYLGRPVRAAVITVPAYFTDAQRQATMDAGRIAGLQVLGTINEPTAAALAYGFDNAESNQGTAMIYDFGGGTFDVSVLDIVNANIDVRSTGGNGHLGGEDIDNLLLEHFTAEFKRRFEIDLFERRKSVTTDGSNAQKALTRLRYACEKAKRKLSSEREARIEIDSLFANHDFDAAVQRGFFENLCKNLIRSTLETVHSTIENANLAIADISSIILVGGSTRIPMVKQMLNEVFSGTNICDGVNPDEAVAYGAAIQAAVLSGMDPRIVRNVHLRDVTPMSLGIETLGGIMATIIPRNTQVPVQKKKTFSTSKDFQTEICFQVFEGERDLTKANNLLGEFTLFGIPPAPKRIPQIEVSFEVNSNGILEVRAIDLSTDAESGIDITNTRGRLNPEDIERAIEEARRMREEDLKYKRKINAREKLEIYANKIGKTLKNARFKEKAGERNVQAIDEMVDASLRLYETCEDPDVTDYEGQMEKLERIWTPIVTKIYPDRKFDNSDAPVMLE